MRQELQKSQGVQHHHACLRSCPCLLHNKLIDVGRPAARLEVHRVPFARLHFCRTRKPGTQPVQDVRWVTASVRQQQAQTLTSRHARCGRGAAPDRKRSWEASDCPFLC